MGAMKSWIPTLLPVIAACNSDPAATSEGDAGTGGNDAVTPTSDLVPEFLVLSDGSGDSIASARFRVGGPDSSEFYDLSEQEQLPVTVEKQSWRLQLSEPHTYTATCPFDGPDVTFVFGLVNRLPAENAPYSTVRPARRITPALTESAVSRASALDFTWQTPVAGDISYSLRGECIAPVDGTTPDDGAHTLAAGQLVEAGSGGTCIVTLTLQRASVGTLDIRFNPLGTIEARQVGKAEFTSAP